MTGARHADWSPPGPGPLLAAGEYMKVKYPNEPEQYGTFAGKTHWWCCTPNDHQGSLANHGVIEHDDGTITVSPSILISAGGKELWHGFLERGVWRSC